MATVLTINRQTRRLVPYLGSVERVPDLFQSNSEDLEIRIVDPTGNSASPYELVDLNGYGLRVSVGATPTGTAGGPSPLALQTSWTWTPASTSFVGSIALNTAAIDSHIGSAASKASFFEVNLTISGNRITVLQEQFTLKAVVDELSSTVPTPTDQYLTKAESLAMFAKLLNDLGAVIVLRSANGTYGRELGVNNDGSAMDNIITL